MGPNRNLDCEQPGQGPTGHFETAPSQVRNIRYNCLFCCAFWLFANFGCGVKKKRCCAFLHIYPWWGVCVWLCAFLFLYSRATRTFRAQPKAPQRQIHDYANGAAHFFCRSVFVFVCFLFHIPSIAGASGVGAGLFLPVNMKDLLALDASSTQRRCLRSRRPKDSYNGTGQSSCNEVRVCKVRVCKGTCGSVLRNGEP